MWDAPWHWVILAVVVIALFGYKRLPDASRALGRSLRIFKTEVKGMASDDAARDAANAAPEHSAQATAAPATPPAATPIATTPSVSPVAAPAEQPTTPGTV
jgi:sec-independent protein translocase protein TatA